VGSKVREIMAIWGKITYFNAVYMVFCAKKTINIFKDRIFRFNSRRAFDWCLNYFIKKKAPKSSPKIIKMALKNSSKNHVLGHKLVKNVRV
jgi:hypothetical protein